MDAQLRPTFHVGQLFPWRNNSTCISVLATEYDVMSGLLLFKLFPYSMFVQELPEWLLE